MTYPLFYSSFAPPFSSTIPPPSPDPYGYGYSSHCNHEQQPPLPYSQPQPPPYSPSPSYWPRSKMTISIFDGTNEDAYWWVLCTEKHFKLTVTPGESKVAEAVAALRGCALQWWLCWSPRHPDTGWDTFTTIFLWRFKPEWRHILPILDEEEASDPESLNSASELSLHKNSVVVPVSAVAEVFTDLVFDNHVDNDLAGSVSVCKMLVDNSEDKPPEATEDSAHVNASGKDDLVFEFDNSLDHSPGFAQPPSVSGTKPPEPRDRVSVPHPAPPPPPKPLDRHLPTRPPLPERGTFKGKKGTLTEPKLSFVHSLVVIPPLKPSDANPISFPPPRDSTIPPPPPEPPDCIFVPSGSPQPSDPHSFSMAKSPPHTTSKLCVVQLIQFSASHNFTAVSHMAPSWRCRPLDLQRFFEASSQPLLSRTIRMKHFSAIVACHVSPPHSQNSTKTRPINDACCNPVSVALRTSPISHLFPFDFPDSACQLFKLIPLAPAVVSHAICTSLPITAAMDAQALPINITIIHTPCYSQVQSMQRIITAPNSFFPSSPNVFIWFAPP